MPNRLPALLLLMLAFASPAPWASPPLVVRHPPVQASNDHRAAYPIALLRLALEKGGADAQVVPSPVPMEQARALRALRQGRLVDVVWTVTTPERERRLRPIRIPIDRGLIGWRVLAVRQQDLPRFARISEIGQLARFTGAQGHDWPDLAILEANGLPTVASPSYAALFELLELGRIDYVARGAGEALPEMASRADDGLVVESTLVLHYPSALYFFVHPDNDALARVLERGLRVAIDDGSLDRLFEQAFGEDLAALRLDGRRRLVLANPQLPRETPLGETRWWYAPEATR